LNGTLTAAAGAGGAMLERLNCAWRVVATGICFATFGIGGLLLRVLVFPALSLGIRERQRRTRAARDVIRHTFRSFVWMMRTFGVLRYEMIGLEKLNRGGLLILANHPTLIDTVFLMAFVKNADCIVKGALWNNPFTGGPVRAAGYINNDQGLELVTACAASLAAGNNLIVFPEGTRTPASGLISLKRGAAHIAVRAGQPVTPVVIRCDPPTLGKGDKWWQVPPRLVQFRIEVMDDIAVWPYADGSNSDGLAARHLTDFLQSFFIEEYQRHA
jgi:1-acyl-sn-glycerol-3-phosphate acyltransferase